ncbi:MAG: hypothetical protein WCP06_04385 [Verrucomicrobiota bacterium]
MFERFPSFTQTFCYREVKEMCKSGNAPAIYSIRTPEDVPLDCPEDLLRATRYLPKGDELTRRSEYGKQARCLPEERFPISATAAQLRELLEQHSRACL